MGNPRIAELVERVRQLEDEIQAEFRKRRAELHADFENRRIRFEQDMLEAQRRFKVGTLRYVLRARPLVLLTAPLIYSVLFPMLLMDLFVTLYQWICFPVYGIPRVRRRDYLVFDRAHLAYLNTIEKINCAYCSYGNGLAAYIREVIGRTEQYWCPIKHSRRILEAHEYYHRYTDFGDAEGFRRELADLRRQLSDLDKGA
ncbi:MAG: hypothetical protein PHU46_05350 [Rhodocyclaceae bacterium]|nr:hypothetical protein [Rhodocyclaceae bacterium]